MKKIISLVILLLIFSLISMIGFTTVDNSEDEETFNNKNWEAERLYEITELRGRNVKAYKLKDGQIQCDIYATDLHYLNQDGVYQDIDNSITADIEGKEGYKYSNTANSWYVYFTNDLAQKNAVLLEKEGYSIAFNLINADIRSKVQKSEALDESASTFDELLSNDNRAVVYKEVYENVDIAYTAITIGLKEEIILRDKNVSNTYAFDVELRGLTPIREEETTYLVNSSGEKIFRLEPMFMEDANGSYSDDVNYKIGKDDNIYRLIVTIDEDFLDAKDTVYPVIIDPTVTVVHGSGNTYDSYVCSMYPDNNYYLNVALRTGKDTYYYVRRTYIKFDLPSIGGTVNGAYLKLKLYSSEGTQRPIAYRVTDSWSSGSITWNNKPDYSVTYNSGIGSNIGNNWYEMDVKDIVLRWYNETYTNYGFMVKDYYETSTSIWGTWHSSDASSGLDKPRLVITYGTPVAYSYGFNADGIDSTGTADEAYYLFDDLGYTRYKYYASTASLVRNGFAERAITFICSHGGAGRICIYDSDEVKTRLSGDASPDPIAYSLEYRYSSGSYTMDPSRLILFAGCHTATDDATYGNLLERAAEYGTDCAVGFTDTIYIGPNSSEIFANALFDELNNGDNISTALYDAKYAVYYHNDQHNYYGYDSYVYDGAVSSPGLVTAKPAQYGQ